MMDALQCTAMYSIYNVACIVCIVCIVCLVWQCLVCIVCIVCVVCIECVVCSMYSMCSIGTYVLTHIHILFISRYLSPFIYITLHYIHIYIHGKSPVGICSCMAFRHGFMHTCGQSASKKQTCGNGTYMYIVMYIYIYKYIICW